MRRLAGAAAAFGAIVLLGGQNGGFPAATWGWAALPLLLVAGGLLFAGVDVTVSRGEALWLGGLLLLAAWTALSGLWATDAGAPVVEAERTVLYACVAGAAVALGARSALPLAVLAACFVLSAWALADAASGHGGARLEGPIGYTNGLGLVAATGAVLAVGLARSRPALLATLAVFVPALALTYSRGSWLALAAGLAVLAAVAARSRPRLLAGGAAAIVLLAAVALLAGHHGAAPGSGGVARLRSLSGNGRGDYWRVALDEAHAHPLLGGGGGTWARWWLAHRPDANGALDAHELYLETLAELGAVGLALLVALLLVPLTRVRSIVRTDWGAASLAAYVALLVHAAVDWDWELPAVALCGLLCATAMVGDGPRLRVPRWPAAAGALVLAAAVFVLQVGNSAAQSASSALDADDTGAALAHAHRAIAWQPWTSSPEVLLGEAQLAAGDLGAAARTLRGVTRTDPSDADAWYQLALATSGSARRTALRRALELDPHGPAAGLR